MLCPHCRVAIHESFTTRDICKHKYTINNQGIKTVIVEEWNTKNMVCPSCYKMIITLQKIAESYTNNRRDHPTKNEYYIYPYTLAKKKSPSKYVPEDIKKDYIEACTIVTLSPQASAALSRRCLQNALDVGLSIKEKNLSQAIKLAIENNKLSSHMYTYLETIREVGNYAAHQKKDQYTKEIISVVPEEANLLLDILEMLFEEIFDKPKIMQEKIEKVNKKLNK